MCFIALVELGAVNSVCYIRDELLIVQGIKVFQLGGKVQRPQHPIILADDWNGDAGHKVIQLTDDNAIPTLSCLVNLLQQYCALAGTTFLHCGPASPEFAIAAIFAIIVMHDAMGVRFETGKQAKILNEMMDIFKSMGNSTLTAEEKLKEFVGHTKLQVAMGALLGIVIAVILG